MPRDPEAILDEYIVLQAMDGLPEAWRQLVESWHPLLVRRATRLLIDPHEAADAVQDTWISVARSLGRLEDPGRFAPWVYRILARRCADRVRRDRGRAEGGSGRSGFDVAETAAAAASGPSEQLDLLRRSIRQLPPEQRVLLAMRYADGVPVRVIAETLGIAMGTVKSRLFTAREALRALVDADRAGEPRCS